MIRDFDDALGLAAFELRGIRVVVLCGESGSGKSSAIQYLLHTHPELATDPELRIIEELRRWPDLKVFFAQWWAGHRLLIASHLPPFWHRLLAVLAPTLVIALDQHPIKMSRWLSARGVPYSDESVAAFCARFGPNYSDAALILRHTESSSFDQALGRFLRQCSLQRSDPEPGQAVLVLDVAAAQAHYRAQIDAV